MRRFTEAFKWSDPWFRKLDPKVKLLWLWLLDSCDQAGVIDLDLELATFQIGYAMGMDTLSQIGDRVKQLPNGKYFIEKFIPFQHGSLSRECKAHNPVFASLSKNGLEGYPKGMDTLQVKVKVKVKEKVIQGDAGGKSRATLEEVTAYCLDAGLPQSDAVWFWNKCEGNGWVNGGKPIKSWRNTIASWKAAGYMASQKPGSKNGASDFMDQSETTSDSTWDCRTDEEKEFQRKLGLK
jgi:hypothetical protein